MVHFIKFSVYLSYRFYRIYRFKWHLSNRFYRCSINRFFFIDRNDKGHLSTSAGAWVWRMFKPGAGLLFFDVFIAVVAPSGDADEEEKQDVDVDDQPQEEENKEEKKEETEESKPEAENAE